MPVEYTGESELYVALTAHSVGGYATFILSYAPDEFHLVKTFPGQPQPTLNSEYEKLRAAISAAFEEAGTEEERLEFEAWVEASYQEYKYGDSEIANQQLSEVVSRIFELKQKAELRKPTIFEVAAARAKCLEQ